jgi:tetratricopeptide (TPR) repeat protein
VIGSGKKGYSYLNQRDGYLFQTPVSWFTQKQRWDLSPGFDPPVLTGRLVPGTCLFCHTNRVREHPEHPDRFVAPVFEGHAIGCERCHGPGELHVGGDMDHTVVNPARLAPALRDSVCEQCHLEGENRFLRSGRGLFDFRPGLPLSDFWAVLVPARRSGEDAKAVNHVEQMHRSKCYQRPVGTLQLGCITCHDPHVEVMPEERETHYRGACLKCHDDAKGQRGCSAPRRQREQTTPRDSCINCHMPPFTNSDIAHAAATDHRIVRRPVDDRPDQTIDPDNALFADFYENDFPKGGPEAERTQAIGLARLISTRMLRCDRHGARALALLESALADYPGDVAIRECKVQILLLMGRHSEAQAEAVLALAKRPYNWRLMVWAASAAQAQGQTDLAIDYWRRAVEINPFMPEHQLSLVTQLIRAGRLDEAEERCGKLLRLDPFSASGRQHLVGILLQRGNKAEALAQFAVIRRLNPPDLPKREAWFEQQLR